MTHGRTRIRPNCWNNLQEMTANSNRRENRQVMGRTGITLPQNELNTNNITWFYCYKTRNIAMNCKKQLNDERKAPTSNKPQGIIAARKVLIECRLFTSKGKLAHPDSEDYRDRNTLRDMRASQLLLTQKCLP